MMNFKGAALPLNDGDIEIIAGYLGLEIAAVRAIIAVESAGRGFANDGRPIILPEPHILGRNTSGQTRDRLLSAGLATTASSQNKYPRTQNERYSWIENVVAITKSYTPALLSCSWGLGQVMGFNHKMLGYDSVQDMVKVAMHSEGAQLFQMARFIVVNRLHTGLKGKNLLLAASWTGFATGYNGQLGVQRGYHTKLANAYRRRPVSERRVPPPATAAQLERLQGRGVVKQATETAKEHPVVTTGGGLGILGSILYAIAAAFGLV